MLRYIIKRILLMIPVIIGVVTLVFTILWFAPGDVADTLATPDTSEEELAQLRHELGLDRPYIVQLADYIWGVVSKMDLGTSTVNKTNIAADLAGRFPNSLRIALGGMILSVLIGIPLGIFAALHQNKAGDAVAMIISLIGISTPGFWFALMLVIVFAFRLPVLPPYGVGSWKHWVMPLTATAVLGIAKLARQTRSSMLEVIRSDYIVMAKSKGLSSRAVIWRHALPNAVMPLITVAGMTFGTQLGGGLIIERVFSIPGIGGYLVDAVNLRDNAAVQGAVIFTAVCFCLVMLLCDLLMAFIDPRVKARYASGAGRRKKKNV